MLQFCHDLFVESCFKNGMSVGNKFSFSADDIENNLIDSSLRKGTLISKFPGTGHYYVALKFETFWMLFAFGLVQSRKVIFYKRL